VQAGDVLYLDANTVHALGPGLVIYEVQQSSDITYRLYDWNRLGLDGQPRPLHIEKGVQVSNVDFVPAMDHPTGEVLVDGRYFTTLRHRLTAETLLLPTEGHFQALSCIEGSLQVSANGVTIALPTGQTALIPAALPEFTLAGTGVILRSIPA
jgi:mannose-6-phosphate isomerase